MRNILSIYLFMAYSVTQFRTDLLFLLSMQSLHGFVAQF